MKLEINNHICFKNELNVKTSFWVYSKAIIGFLDCYPKHQISDEAKSMGNSQLRYNVQTKDGIQINTLNNLSKYVTKCIFNATTTDSIPHAPYLGYWFTRIKKLGRQCKPSLSSTVHNKDTLLQSLYHLIYSS